jgi:NitT/TauT family transport system substrate-binding protein
MKGKKAVLFLAGIMALGMTACDKEPKNEVKVYMPDGAPALALAKLMHEDKNDDGVSYFVVDAKTIAARVTNGAQEKNAEICVMPVTAASKLLGTGQRYQMLALATQGNLFLLSKTQETEIVKDGLQGLLGKTVLVSQMNEVPGLTLKATLAANGVAWQELTSGVGVSETKVNLVAAAESYDFEVVAEPAVSKRLAMNKGWKVVGDIQKLYGGENDYGFPQAAIVAKTSFVAENGEWTKDFLNKISLAQSWLVGENATEIYQAVTSHFEDKAKTPVFSAETLTSETLNRCGVQFALAKDCKEKTAAYITGLLAVNENAVKMPAAAFYWSGSID